MRKLILTERQYNNIKNVLIENAINKSLLNEESYTLDTKKYSLTTNDFTDVKGGEIKVIGGITYVPTQRGNLTAKGEIEYKNSGSRKKTTINFICANNKINTDGKYYDVLSNDTTLKGFQDLCKSLKNKKDFYGIQQTGGAVKGYTQQNTYTLKSKDGKKTITIPAKTGYTAKTDQKGNEGATFKLGPTIFGWFGCKSKSFFINKVLYIDEKGGLVNNLSKSVCGGSEVLPSKDSSEPEEVLYKGGGSSDTSTSSFDASQFDQYI
jgi:hypothetical protein